MREHDGFLQRVEQRFSRLAGWLSTRRRGDAAGDRDLHAVAEALGDEVARARRALADTLHEDVARVRASLEDMSRDYDAPPPRYALHRAELDALRRHLHVTARLIPELANADSPRWDEANEQYERSWLEVERAFEEEGQAASP
jgi:hypothetical protein